MYGSRINLREVVGLVGESGSGKSTVAIWILRLLEFKSGGAAVPLDLKPRSG